MISAPPEAQEKLEIYHGLLLKWQKAINLVSGKTLDEARQRHFADSAQIKPHIPEWAKTLVDMGSGAGFPGMVLAILRPDLDVHLVESDQRKCEFLRTVSRETGSDVTIHASRIEDVKNEISPDIVTARALAPLSDLLAYCQFWGAQKPDLEMIFLKGQGVYEEIEAAQALYSFGLEEIQSKVSDQGKILQIKALSACA